MRKFVTIETYPAKSNAVRRELVGQGTCPDCGEPLDDEGSCANCGYSHAKLMPARLKRQTEKVSEDQNI